MLEPRKTLMLILLIAAVAVTAVIPLHRLLRSDPPPQRLTIEKIQSLSSLVTARVQVADVILVDQHGLTGGMQVAAVIRGDYLLMTDLAQARFERVDPSHRTADLLLAPPLASSPRVDLQRSRLFGLSQYGLWQIVPGDGVYTDIVNKSYQQAQEMIVVASADPVALQQARRQAEAVLIGFLRALNWNVAVRWQDQPATRSAESVSK